MVPPMGLYWEFEYPSAASFEFGDAEITAKFFKASALILSRGHRTVGGQVKGEVVTVSGQIKGEVVTGTDHKLSRVTFHLHDYPDLMGGAPNVVTPSNPVLIGGTNIVATTTPLERLLQPNMGQVWWSACATEYNFPPFEVP
jgi:hypothetical protein